VCNSGKKLVKKEVFMKTVCKINMCNGCMACVERCPSACITVQDDVENYNAVIEEEKCINCGICKKVCPRENAVKKERPFAWYQGWTEQSIRKISSSGGAASAIMHSFMDNGGYVAACAFEDGRFGFKLTNDREDIKRFAGSKYVKSNPLGIYKKIQERIKTDRVLFIGLPCQVAALNNWIKNKENLYTIDLICHGTPSPRLLESFLNEHDQSLFAIKDIRFRTKMDMGIGIEGTKLTSHRVIDDYLCAFLESVNYTANCYSCDYASLDRVSDITLGDSWGTEFKNEELNGVSLILVQSIKGQELMDKANIELQSVDLKTAIENNHQLEYPSVLTNKRRVYFDLLSKGKSFSSATFHVLPKLVMKQKIKHIMIKLGLLKMRGGIK